MKRILSVMLAVCIVLGLSVGALAATVSIKADPITVKAGEDVTVTASLDEAFTAGGADFRLYFDSNLFTFKSFADAEGGPEFETSKLKTDNKTGASYYLFSFLTLKNTTVQPGDLCSFVFTAKTDLTAEQTAAFTPKFQAAAGENAQEVFVDVGPAVTVTVTPAAQTSKYSVAASTTPSTTVGSDATVSLNVTNAATSNKYNSYYFEVSYDNTVLEYDSNNAGAAVSAANGKLTIAGYGADRTAPIVLTFKGLKVGSSNVTITKANIDAAENAHVQNAPAAEIATPAVTITVTAAEYTVDLSDDFTGDSTVKPGDNYTFTAKDKHYDYTISAKMGSSTADVIDNGDGSFTIKNVTGNLTITDTKTPKSYTVTVEGTGKADVNAANTATYLTAYTFTLTKDEAYTYEVTVTVDGTAYTPTLNADGKTYTIAGDDVTGNVVITVNKDLKPVTTTEITFTGSGSADVVGGTTQTAENGKDFTFKLNADADYDYTVKLGTETLTPDTSGKYTIPSAKLTGTALTVTVEKTAKQTAEVNVYEYVKLNGKNIYLVTASGTVADGKVMAYDGSAMFWSEKYQAYAYLVISNTELTKAEAAKKVSQSTATKTSIAYDGDVNLTGKIDVNDAQLVWNMYNAKYEDFNTVSMRKFLEADLNGDHKLTVLDAAAVITKMLG